MSTISLHLPDSLHKQVRKLAEKESVSINQLITLALSEKLSALMTKEYLTTACSGRLPFASLEAPPLKPSIRWKEGGQDMNGVTKGRKRLSQITSSRIGLLLLVVAASCLLMGATDVQGQSIVGPGEGRVLQVLGESITVKISGEQTDGKYAVIEEVSPFESGPPLHVHRHEDEVFYVLEGKVEFQLGDQRFSAKAGSVAFLPKNIPHTVSNVGSTPSKVLVVIIPAGFVKFFEDIDALAKPTSEQAMELGKKYDLTFLPPPKGN